MIFARRTTALIYAFVAVVVGRALMATSIPFLFVFKILLTKRACERTGSAHFWLPTRV